MANTGGIEHSHRAIPLRSPLLRVEWVIGGTPQRSIWLHGEIGSGKSFGERSACPLSRPIADRLTRFHWLTRFRRLIRFHWLTRFRRLIRFHWLTRFRRLIRFHRLTRFRRLIRFHRLTRFRRLIRFHRL